MVALVHIPSGSESTSPDPVIESRPTANVYVDGFNLYNRALRDTPYKWLDLEAMSSALLKRYDIHRIRYFTALIKARPEDPQGPSRQNAYLRAIATNPKLSVHYGQFQVTKPWMVRHPIARDEDGQVEKVRVFKTEEKGSDVNIATYMMYDAFQDDADIYVLVSNDSDLSETVRILSKEMGRKTGIIFPVENPSNELLKTQPTVTRQIREGVLQSSQMPSPLQDADGEIIKPSIW